MNYQKLTGEQKRIRNWRIRRNRIASKLMEADPKLLTMEAIRLATRKAGPMPAR